MSKRLLDDPDEAAWDAAFADPRSADFFAVLAAEAEAEEMELRQLFPKPKGWTEADEARERELDRQAGIGDLEGA